MKELRAAQAGRFASCSSSTRAGSAILLLGGDKAENGRWYRQAIAEADHLYDTYLKSCQEEGLKSDGRTPQLQHLREGLEARLTGRSATTRRFAGGRPPSGPERRRDQRSSLSSASAAGS